MPRRVGFDQARARSVERGVGFLERLAKRRGGLDQFGSGLLYCCGFLSATTPDPTLKMRAQRLTHTAFQSWCLANAEALHDGCAPSITAAVQTMDAVSRAGKHYPRIKRHLAEAARRCDATEFHGFDARHEGPPSDIPDLCDCGVENRRGARKCANCGAKLTRMPAMRAWYMCFIGAYCGERYGVKLGVNFKEAVQWLPAMRNYLGPKRGWGRFHDSVYGITHLVYTLNDYGQYLLKPEWLAYEYAFLQKHWAEPIEADDPDMTGEFLDSLRAFGLTESDPAIRYAMEYLIESQNEDGSWGAKEKEVDYRRFHATWAAIDGLREFRWKRYGLSFPKLLPMVESWAKQ